MTYKLAYNGSRTEPVMSQTYKVLKRDNALELYSFENGGSNMNQKNVPRVAAGIAGEIILLIFINMIE